MKRRCEGGLTLVPNSVLRLSRIVAGSWVIVSLMMRSVRSLRSGELTGKGPRGWDQRCSPLITTMMMMTEQRELSLEMKHGTDTGLRLAHKSRDRYITIREGPKVPYDVFVSWHSTSSNRVRDLGHAKFLGFLTYPYILCFR